MSYVISLLKSYWPLFLLLIIYVGYLLLAMISDFSYWFDVIINVMLLSPISYILVFGKSIRYNAFVYGSLYITLLLAVAFIALFVFKPATADWLAREDFIIENLTAVAAVLAAIVVGVVGVSFFRQKNVVRATFSAIIASAFFVIGMEEISWGQRLFSIESSEFFLENNMQAEINFHNLHTPIFMALFIVAVFIIFTVVPFYEKQINDLLKKIKLPNLAIFIPSQWLILVFILTLGFSSSFARLSDPYQIAVLIFTLMIAAYFIAIKAPKYIEEHKIILYLTVMFVFLGIIVINLIDYQGLGLRPHFPPEYREFFICWGILLYTVDLLLRARSEAISSS